MAGASTVAVGVATGIMMDGAIAASADAAGIMKVFEAADLNTKALAAAASMAENFVEAVDSMEVVEVFTGAEDFMVVAAAEVAMGVGK